PSQPGHWIYEVKLADRFLMSSHVTDSERELARRGLARAAGSGLSVLVGGLGLGYTAAEALTCDRVERVVVVERLPEVLGWFERGLVPMAQTLCDEPRCELRQGDCLAMLREPDPEPFDVVLIDIDDSPIHLLSDDHEEFYSVAGLAQARRSLRPGGVLALWTSLPAEPEVTERLQQAFTAADVEEVRFDNPLLQRGEVNAIYFASA
ncbi:MAG: spermidine synthase, partial [Planctomycetota bacterium]|nr:spermidine synthase [Planctomycetota bacterium]